MRHRSAASDLTMAEASVVLPVPAEPRISMAAMSERAVMNEANVAMAFRWSAVGAKPSSRVTMSVSASVIMSCCVSQKQRYGKCAK